MIRAEVITNAGDIELNAGRRTTTVTVAKAGDRPERRLHFLLKLRNPLV